MLKPRLAVNNHVIGDQEIKNPSNIKITQATLLSMYSTECPEVLGTRLCVKCDRIQHLYSKSALDRPGGGRKNAVGGGGAGKKAFYLWGQ
jgi:hypothetical protein